MQSLNSEAENKFRQERREFIASVNPEIAIDNFPLFSTRIELGRFLVRYELFKKILNIKGSIVECGVYQGASLMLFAKLSSIYEPYAFNREIIGFDTFTGFPSINAKDGPYAYTGDLAKVDLAMIEKSIKLFDCDRPIGHVPKVKLIKGDACETIPKYFTDNPHALVAMLYLDFDLYEPSKIALKTILPRLPKGAIVAFDELNERRRQGETIALLESLNLNKYTIKKFPEEPHISYIKL